MLWRTLHYSRPPAQRMNVWFAIVLAAVILGWAAFIVRIV